MSWGRGDTGPPRGSLAHLPTTVTEPVAATWSRTDTTSQEYPPPSWNRTRDTLKVPSAETEYLHRDGARELRAGGHFAGLGFCSTPRSYLSADSDSISFRPFLLQTTWAGGRRGSV